MIATAVVVTGLAILSSSLQQAQYQSSAQVFLSGARNLPSNLADSQQYAIDPERSAATQASLARVPGVAQRALRDAGIRNRSSESLLGSTKVSAEKDADILSISVTDSSKEGAKRLATAYAGAYVNYRRSLDTASIVETRRQVEQRLRTLERTNQTKTGVYRQLARQDGELGTLQATQGSNASLIRPGSPAVKVQPKTARNAVLGLILGLVFGVALAFLREALNTRVRSAEEIQERLGVPLLARVPEPPKRLASGDSVAILSEPHAPETEVYRVLATNLGFANLDRGARTIMVSSAIRDEGKTTTVANTAVALARSGSRVALVDLDLKRPALDRMFGLRGRELSGISDVALGRVALEDALTRVPLSESEEEESPEEGISGGKLWVLQTGPIPPNTADFVASSRLGEVLDELAGLCDYVLVDAPPILQVSDAMALTAKVDAMVLVTRLEVVRRPTLNELRRVLDHAPTAKLGFILTGASGDEGYGYGYGYGYGAYTSANGAMDGGRRSLRERMLQ